MELTIWNFNDNIQNIDESLFVLPQFLKRQQGMPLHPRPNYLLRIWNTFYRLVKIFLISNIDTNKLINIDESAYSRVFVRAKSR